jgi:hypothetical protein
MHVRARMRMHVGSDHVDRRLVTKLIVTYIDRNQDKQTLELMSRMLQFTEVCVSGMCQRCVSGVSAVCVSGMCQRCASEVCVRGVCQRCVSEVSVRGECQR